MRVCIVPEYPMSLMTGGLQVQAVETFRALSAIGQEAQLFEWSANQPVADLYHFMGFPPHLHRIAELVRQGGRPYIITMLFGSREQLWISALRQRLKSQVLRQRDRYNAIMGAAKIVTITEADAEAARLIYGLEKSRVHVVPNGVGDEFFTSQPDAWRTQYGKEGFVLCVGAIQPRKNQLLLLEACNAARLPAVLLGPVLPGDRDYANQVAAAVRINEQYGGRWLTSLRNEDPLLPSAYAACRLFSLLSAQETQPLSVMQAMAARKPILLMRAPYTDDALFHELPTISSRSVDAVASALDAAWNKGKAAQLPDGLGWNSVARHLVEIYHKAV